MCVCVCVCVCVGSIDGTVRCWDTRSRRFEPIQILDEARDGISNLKVAEHELLTGSVGRPPHGSRALHRNKVLKHGSWNTVLEHCTRTGF